MTLGAVAEIGKQTGNDSQTVWTLEDSTGSLIGTSGQLENGNRVMFREAARLPIEQLRDRAGSSHGLSAV